MVALLAGGWRFKARSSGDDAFLRADRQWQRSLRQRDVQFERSKRQFFQQAARELGLMGLPPRIKVGTDLDGRTAKVRGEVTTKND
jgi:hypothetical protein